MFASRAFVKMITSLDFPKTTINIHNILQKLVLTFTQELPISLESVQQVLETQNTDFRYGKMGDAFFALNALLNCLLNEYSQNFHSIIEKKQTDIGKIFGSFTLSRCKVF